ncbi:MAG TPA: PilZ domain-containing protein [Pyrinomonadaceae bacterium]|nr:PilZ domain-containing protein [Pyrinomonadaceae bacterium]
MRSIAGRLRALVGARRSARRYRVRVTAAVSLVDAKPNAPPLTPPLACHTVDISASGLALAVPSIRVGERYLTGDGRLLLVALELPSGPLALRAAPVRYERLEEPDTGYIIGARITSFDGGDGTPLAEFLRTLAGDR